MDAYWLCAVFLNLLVASVAQYLPQEVETLSKCVNPNYDSPFETVDHWVKLECDEGNMISVVNATYSGSGGDTSCQPVDYSSKAKRYCDNTLDCELSASYSHASHDFLSIQSCLTCITISYKCIKAHCKVPDPPLFGMINVTAVTSQVGDHMGYSCEPGFTLHGNPTRRCALVRHHYAGIHLYYEYKWFNITTPKCVLDVRTCPRTAQTRNHPIGTYEGSCYEWVHEKRKWSAAKSDCEARNATLMSSLTTEAYPSVIDTTPPLNTSRHNAWGRMSQGVFWLNDQIGQHNGRGMCLSMRLYFHKFLGNFSHSARMDCEAENYYICKYTLIPSPSCDHLDDIDNGQLSTDNNDYGTVVVFSCQPGYALVGSASRKCMHNGLWSGEQPVCRVTDCGPPPKSNDSILKVNVTSTKYQGSVTYSCPDDYRIDGFSRLECLIDGSWSGDGPACVSATQTVSAKTSRSTSIYTTTTPVKRTGGRSSQDPEYTKTTTTSAGKPMQSSSTQSPIVINIGKQKKTGDTAPSGVEYGVAAGVPVLLVLLLLVLAAVILIKKGYISMPRRTPKSNLPNTAMDNPLYATFQGGGEPGGIHNPVYDSIDNFSNLGGQHLEGVYQNAAPPGVNGHAQPVSRNVISAGDVNVDITNSVSQYVPGAPPTESYS